MTRHRIITRAALIAVLSGLVGACTRIMEPVRQPGLEVVIVYPDDRAGARAKPVRLDTAGAVTRMELVVTTREGKEVARRQFTKTDDGWEIEASLAPASDLTVRVMAWHHDALIYSGADSGVTVEPGTVTTTTVILESYRPRAHLALARNESGPFAICADPRGSGDRMSTGDKLRVRYDWEDDGTWDSDYRSLIPQVHQYAGPGPYTVRAGVINPAGLITEVVEEIVLAPKAPPLNPVLSMTPREGEPGTLFTADATGSVADLTEADSVMFRWDWDGDGAWDTPWSPSAIVQVLLVETGTYRVLMEMKASEKRAGRAEASVVVGPSTAPSVVARLVASPLAAGVNAPVFLDASASRANGNEGALRFRWDWDGDGVWDTDWKTESSASVTYSTPGAHRAQVEVGDGSGQCASAWAEVLVSTSRHLEPGQEVTIDNVPMRYVPAGTFPMGTRNMTADEFPVHTVSMRGFLMDTYEVTNVEYQRFVTATGHRAPPHWIGGRYPAGQGNLPVVKVSWSDATAYAAWRGERLPTGEEWEYAARGSDGRTFPWGNYMEPGRANYGLNPVEPVGQHPRGASPFGLQDMAGNVWEWTASLYLPYPGFLDYILVNPTTQGHFDENRYLISGNPFTPERSSHRVARGGAVGIDLGTNGIELRSSNREPLDPGTRDRVVGFRCVRDLE